MNPREFFEASSSGTFTVSDGVVTFVTEAGALSVKPYGSAGLLFSVEDVEQPDMGTETSG